MATIGLNLVNSSRLPSVTIFDFAIRFLLIFLPFSSFVSVFLTYQIGIQGASFIKELALIIAATALVYTYLMSYLGDRRYLLKLTIIDYLIIAYMAIMVSITLTTTGIRGLIYGGRYDFSFLLTFMIAYHGFPLLTRPISYYLRIFLISAGSMLFISGLLKWPLNEEILLYFGYSGNPSAWDFGGAPPIFHGIDGANVRRFQGLLDGPNTMGAFLIVFSGIFAYFVRFRREWYYAIAIVLLGLFVMVFYTYSRSALLAITLSYFIVIVMTIGSLWKFYRVQFISTLLIFTVFTAIVGVLYYDRAAAIVGRSGSTLGHTERMKVGINRTLSHPLGQGLGSAGPAYRYVMDLSDGKSNNTDEIDRFYIPESWYIQQFIEGGYVGGLIFLSIMLVLFLSLLAVHPILGALFAGVGIMNFFLHTFESSVVSLLLFLLIGLLLAYNKNARK
ncbi:O-antigen ligase family protein [Candidatus Gracilibacteria bacterium]|nr:O-antigen ligase family protein [Candidatus Gracilibacteria bacterium]